MNKNKLYKFIGVQLNRLKLGQTYYSIILTTVSAISLVKIAFPKVETLYLLILFPIILLISYFIGYFFDKKGVITEEHRKGYEIFHRYLNTQDFKLNDFRLFQMKIFVLTLQKLQNEEKIDLDIIEKEYQKYLKKWSKNNEK